jgi:hypothetical protein
MSIKIPKNTISYKYTSGGEYVFKDSNIIYKGYYYEINGKFFNGRDFDINASELIKITSNGINPLLKNLTTFLYGTLSSNNQNIQSSKINSLANDINPNLDQSGEKTYYSRKINEIPYSIKQIDKITYDNIKSNPLYKTVELNKNYSNLEQSEQIIPGLKKFLGY